MIRHEDDLRNDRLGYVLTINGFLFTGLGFAWGAAEAKRLVVLFGLFGMAIAAVSMQAMATSSEAISRLKERGEDLPDDGLPLVGLSSGQIKGPWRKLEWLAPWAAVPWALFIVWPALAIVRLV
jgi:hypothetical protein